MQEARECYIQVKGLRRTPDKRKPEPTLIPHQHPPRDFAGELSIWLRSDTKYVSAIRGLLSAVCADTRLGEEELEELKIAVGEAVCNAIEHGSPHGRDDYIRVTCSIGPTGVTVSVFDTGGGFLATPRKSRPGTLREGGYGLLLIERLASAVHIASNRLGATVTLEKRFLSAV